MAMSAGLLRGRRAGDRGRLGERCHVGELARGGMEALPQRGERLHAVESQWLDPGLGELRLRELRLPEAVLCGALMRPPRGPAPARSERLPEPGGDLVLVRPVRDGDPPACRDGGLL